MVFCVIGLGGLYLEGLKHGGAYFRNFTVRSLSLLSPFTMVNKILIFFLLEVINSKIKVKGKLGHNIQIHVCLSLTINLPNIYFFGIREIVSLPADVLWG